MLSVVPADIPLSVPGRLRLQDGDLFWSYNQSPVNIQQFLLGVLKQKLERLIRCKEALSLYIE